jgi:hypothetical protein
VLILGEQVRRCGNLQPHRRDLERRQPCPAAPDAPSHAYGATARQGPRIVVTTARRSARGV